MNAHKPLRKHFTLFVNPLGGDHWRVVIYPGKPFEADYLLRHHQRIETASAVYDVFEHAGFRRPGGVLDLIARFERGEWQNALTVS